MPKDLIIVESPAKTKTLSQFLGSSYQVMASMGHVRDLPKSKLGVDVEQDFEPSYTVIPERKSILTQLKKAAKDSRAVYLASDPDREGEAIAWHLQEALGLKNEKRIELHNEEAANTVRTAHKGGEWKVASIKKREQRRQPDAPFITSTLQQEAARKLGFSSKRTMMAAQQLYEGIDLGSQGHVGLITYMRTDSVNIAQEAQAEAREFIEKSYGKEDVPAATRQYKSKKGAQEAHEAIRPTSVLRRPEELKGHL